MSDPIGVEINASGMTDAELLTVEAHGEDLVLRFGIFTVTADASELAQAIGDARWPQHLEEAA